MRQSTFWDIIFTPFYSSQARERRWVSDKCPPETLSLYNYFKITCIVFSFPRKYIFNTKDSLLRTSQTYSKPGGHITVPAKTAGGPWLELSWPRASAGGGQSGSGPDYGHKMLVRNWNYLQIAPHWSDTPNVWRFQ